jgi:hypothetical protein
MRTITLHSYGKSNVEALTDCCAENNGHVVLLSIIGNDSVVKAISGTLLDSRHRSAGDIYIGDEDSCRGKRYLYRGGTSVFKVITAKLGQGVTHQLIYDMRFFRLNEKDVGNFDEGTRYVFLRPGDDAADLVYQSVLKGLPTPTLPEWGTAIYKKLRKKGKDRFGSWRPGRIREVDTYPSDVKVLSVQVSEEGLDAIVSDLVKRGKITWE